MKGKPEMTLCLVIGVIYSAGIGFASAARFPADWVLTPLGEVSR
jgi:hypothetical protein